MKKKTVYCIILALWLSFIFGQSCVPLQASKGESDIFVRFFSFLPLDSAIMETAVRKAAHVFEYLVLSAVFASGFPVFGKRIKYVYPLFFSLITAVLDEYLQFFTGRGSQVPDVLIDFAGAVIGVLIFRMIYKSRDCQNNKSDANKKHL